MSSSGPEPGPELQTTHEDGTGTGPALRYSVEVAAQRLGITPRAVRKRIQAGTLAGVNDGRKWFVFLTADESGTGPEPGTGPQDRSAEPDAGPQDRNRTTTPADIEQAIERTQARYMADLRTMLDDVGALYQGQLAAKDETIVELRRRAEQAEAEVLRLQQQPDRGAPISQTDGAEERPPWWKVWAR